MTASGDHLQPGIGSVDDCRMSPPEQPRTGEALTSSVLTEQTLKDRLTEALSLWQKRQGAELEALADDMAEQLEQQVARPSWQGLKRLIEQLSVYLRDPDESGGFAGYRQRIADELARLGYWSDWRLVHASEFGVPQLRPRYVLVAMKMEDAAYFSWPEPTVLTAGLGPLIGDLLGANGWPGAEVWAGLHEGSIAPTIVGGSKRHGGADLGPTRAKAAWRRLGIDGHGVADRPPAADDPVDLLPRLTTDMVARIQGWLPPVGKCDPYAWSFTGRKTSRYRQIGNAFPPPVARAIGGAVSAALRHEGPIVRDPMRELQRLHDPVLLVLQATSTSLSLAQIARRSGLSRADVAKRLAHLEGDFEISIDVTTRTARFALEGFRGFIGQEDHVRHQVFAERLASIS